jgi:hypothetical protein
MLLCNAHTMQIKDLDVEQGDWILAKVWKPSFRIPDVTVFPTTPAHPTLKLQQRPLSAPTPRFANEPPGGFAAPRPILRQRWAKKPPEGFTGSRPPPPSRVELYILPHVPPPSPRPVQPFSHVSRAPRLPCIEWLDDNENSIKMTAISGTAVYHNRSYQFRVTQ